MSDYNNLTANLQVATLNTANIGVGRYILNDYVIEIIEAEDGNGYTMNIRKGSQVQTMHLTELTPEYVNKLINDGLREAKASGEFDGFSPIATVEDSVIGAKITITDKNGTTTEYVRDGRDGKDGVDGFSPTVRAMETADGIAVTATQKDGTFDIVHVNDGYSPTANIAKNGDTQVITITDKNGTTTADILDGLSPTANVVKENGARFSTVTITDKNGTTTADILDGVGISSAVLDESTYQLTLYFTDGTSYTTQPIRGQKGDTGPQGLKGDPGESFNLHVCVSSEYDENTGLPIISNPESNTMYLVPAEREEQGDLFVEWVYVNNSWEKFGSTAINITTPDWEATSTDPGYIENKPSIKEGSGVSSLAQGNSIASGAYSFAAGYSTTSSGNRSHSEGMQTIAKNRSQHVFGEYNVEDPSSVGNTSKGNYVEIVGNGTTSARSNARTLDWSGNEWLSGTLKVGGTGYDDSNAIEVATKNDIVSPDWEAAEGEDGYIENRPQIYKGTARGSLQNTAIDAVNATGMNAIALGFDSYAFTLNITGDASSTVYSYSPEISELRARFIKAKAAYISIGIPSNIYKSAIKILDIDTESKTITLDATLSEESALSNQSAYVFIHAVSSGVGSFTSGYVNIASGNASTALGTSTIASGNSSATFGASTVASGLNSVAFGNNTASNHKSQYVFGEYNIEDINTATATKRGNYIEIVGNGTADDAKSNARTLDWSGNQWLAGNLKVGGTGYDDVNAKTVATLDDTAGAGDTDKTWSADKIAAELANAGTLQDVTIDGTSVVSNGIAEIPIANNSGGLGIVCFDATKGVGIGSATNAATIVGATSVDIKVGTHNYSPIVPSHQHESTFYGLAKAAGDSTQSASSNAVGTYTEDAKSAIKQMFGVIDPESEIDDTAGVGDTDKTWSADKISSELANAGSVQDVTVNGTSIVDANGNAAIPKATNISLGLVKGSNSIDVLSSGTISVIPATETMVKELSDNDRAVTSGRLTNGVFYGLAKASGDITQSASLNAVGTYTDNAKSAIKAMLGISGETQKVTVSGTAPVIVANQNTRYVCGEVVSLDFTPSADGICDVIFTSGSTVTVLTIPNTVIFPEWFDPTALDTNTTYEINISDGVYGAVMVW